MKYTINLSSRSYVNKRGLYLLYAVCSVVLLAGLFFNASYYFRLNGQIATTEEHLAELEKKLLESQGADAVSYSAANYDRLVKKIGTANSILERDAFRWTILLGQLEKVVPNNVSIQQIEPEHKSRSVSIKGLAKNLRDMKAFLDNLLKSKTYGNVLLLEQATVSVEGGPDLISFSVTLQEAF